MIYWWLSGKQKNSQRIHDELIQFVVYPGLRAYYSVCQLLLRLASFVEQPIAQESAFYQRVGSKVYPRAHGDYSQCRET
jgi:hypothetical protein